MESQHSAMRRQWKSAQELDIWWQAAEPRTASRDKVSGRKWCLSWHEGPGFSSHSSHNSAHRPGPRKGRTQQQWEAQFLQEPGQPAACPGQQKSPMDPTMKYKQPIKTIPPATHSANWGLTHPRVCGQGWGGKGRGVRRGVQGVSRRLLLLRQDRAWLFQLWKTIFLTFGCCSALRKHFVYIQTGSL